MIETRHVVRCDEPDCDSELGPFDTQRLAREALRKSDWIELVRRTKTIGLRCNRHDEPKAAVG